MANPFIFTIIVTSNNCPIVVYDVYDGEFVGEARTKKEARRFGIPRVHPTTKMVTLWAGKLQLPFKPLG